MHTTKGSGLGLSLVRHIMQAHGGEVEVESQPGEGSTFTLSLPLAPSGAAAGRGRAPRYDDETSRGRTAGLKGRPQRGSVDTEQP